MNPQDKVTMINGIRIKNRQLLLLSNQEYPELNAVYNIYFRHYIARGKRNRFHRKKFITVFRRNNDYDNNCYIL